MPCPSITRILNRLTGRRHPPFTAYVKTAGEGALCEGVVTELGSHTFRHGVWFRLASETYRQPYLVAKAALYDANGKLLFPPS